MCPHEMATNPDLIGYANRRSLIGNAPMNYESVQQKHANQRTLQSVGNALSVGMITGMNKEMGGDS